MERPRTLHRSSSTSYNKSMRVSKIVSLEKEELTPVPGAVGFLSQKISSKDDLSLINNNKLAREPKYKDKNWQRIQVVTELVETEKKFVGILTIIETFFKVPLKERGIVSEEIIDSIFSNIHEIRRLQNYFLDQLLFIIHSVPIDDPKTNPLSKCKTLSQLFCKYSTLASIFSRFCSSHSSLHSQKIIPNLIKNNAQFESFINVSLKYYFNTLRI